MRLVACSNCHAQYDVTNIIVKEFECRCGETVQNRELKALETNVQRCSACGALITNPDLSERCDYCQAVIVRDERRLSLICPECYARNAEDAKFCTGCGIGFCPEPIQERGEEHACPVCEVLMPASSISGIGLNECPRCHGLWVPGENFDLLINRAIKAQQESKNEFGLETGEIQPRTTGANPASQGVQYRRCPICETYMQRHNYRKKSGVIIDSCYKHGTWLDADELEQIAGFILSGGHLNAPEDIKRTPETIRTAIASAEFDQLHLKANEAEARMFPKSQPSSRQGDLLGRGIIGLLEMLLG